MIGRLWRTGGRGESGFVAAELAIGLALLVLPVGCLVLTLPTWAERQATARAVAREVGRSTAVAGTCDADGARVLARQMAVNLGLRSSDVSIALDCRPGAVLPRAGQVTATVTVEVPAVAIPGMGDVGAWHFTVGHTESLDPYRSVG